MEEGTGTAISSDCCQWTLQGRSNGLLIRSCRRRLLLPGNYTQGMKLLDRRQQTVGIHGITGYAAGVDSLVHCISARLWRLHLGPTFVEAQMVGICERTLNSGMPSLEREAHLAFSLPPLGGLAKLYIYIYSVGHLIKVQVSFRFLLLDLTDFLNKFKCMYMAVFYWWLFAALAMMTFEV